MKSLLVMLAVVIGVMASTGFDLSSLTSVESFQCLVNKYSATFTIIRAYRSIGAIDPNIKTNLKNAQDAGIFFTDIYMFPCRGKSPVDQVGELIDYLNGTDYNYLWVNVETNPSPGCSWAAATPADNCVYLDQLVSEISRRGKAPGIFTSSSMWSQIMGSTGACQKFKTLPLWFAHYDKTQSFDDFVPFGGWTKPNYKQYEGGAPACGTGVNLDWYPQCSGEGCLSQQ